MNSTWAHNVGLHGLFISSHETDWKKVIDPRHKKIEMLGKFLALFTPYWALVHLYRVHLPFWFQLIPVRIGKPS